MAEYAYLLLMFWFVLVGCWRLVVGGSGTAVLMWFCDLGGDCRLLAWFCDFVGGDTLVLGYGLWYAC